jgi:hypothetical protein
MHRVRVQQDPMTGIAPAMSARATRTTTTRTGREPARI